MTEMVYGSMPGRVAEPVLPRWWRTIDKTSMTAILILFAIGLLLGLAAICAVVFVFVFLPKASTPPPTTFTEQTAGQANLTNAQEPNRWNSIVQKMIAGGKLTHYFCRFVCLIRLLHHCHLALELAQAGHFARQHSCLRFKQLS